MSFSKYFLWQLVEGQPCLLSHYLLRLLEKSSACPGPWDTGHSEPVPEPKGPRGRRAAEDRWVWRGQSRSEVRGCSAGAGKGRPERKWCQVVQGLGEEFQGLGEGHLHQQNPAFAVDCLSASMVSPAFSFNNLTQHFAILGPLEPVVRTPDCGARSCFQQVCHLLGSNSTVPDNVGACVFPTVCESTPCPFLSERSLRSCL